MKVLAIALTFFLLITTVRAGDGIEVKPDTASFIAIIKERQIDEYTLSVKGLKHIMPMLWAKIRETFEKEHGKMKYMEIKPPPNVADAFEYIIYLSQDGKTYWIFRQGGIAGVSEYWGPGTVKADGEI